MDGRKVGHLVLAALLVAPSALAVAYGAVGIVWSATVWEASPHARADVAPPLTLQPGRLYQLVVTTACFAGPDYRVQLAVWSEETGDLAADARGALFETRHECRSLYQSREFAVREAANFTMAWNLSEQVFAHGPVVRLVVRMMTLVDGLDYICLGAIGGIFSYPVALALYGWLGKRPPKRGRAVTRVVRFPGRASF